MKNNQKYTGLEIAITGMSCRFPGADNWRTYWDNLINGVESIDFLPHDERKIHDEHFVRAVTHLESKHHFDSAFFDYRPDEARLMNPLHRIFHECIWEALEDAGIDPGRSKGPIGLYVGGGDDLHWRLYSKLKNINQEIDDFSLYTLNSRDFLASTLSYKLNLKGPSFTINTTCSTSLVAVHLACKSLLLGETRVALAGGVTLKTHKQDGYTYQEGMIFSNDGHCRAFDQDASGTMISEGAGVVVLKRLNDALEDGDEIYSIIKGSAINNDGNRKVGFTAASVEGQSECIKKAHRFSKVEPESITYVETHGTGTRLGDPIEVEALNLAFGKKEGHKCAIGSVKTNIGHTDTAAGVAGLIKTALSLKYKLLPPSLNFKVSNPEINFSDGPFYVNTVLKKWEPLNDLPLRAGVSSFGIGGTNAHLILEEPPVLEDRVQEETFHLLTVSAKSENALARYLDKLGTFLSATPEINLASLSHTFQQGRKHFTFRKPIVYEDLNDLIAILHHKKTPEIFRSEDRKGLIVFMFSGQGSQYAEMGKDLYVSEALFREEMDKGFDVIRELTGEDFKAIWFPGNADPKKINETRYAQPLIFLLEYALSSLLKSWGILPQYMIGHSIGEYVAATLAGVFTLEDALKIVVKRGEIINALPGGAMLSIAASPSEVGRYLNDHISLAAINGPDQVVLSGTFEAIDELKRLLDNAGISFVTLHTSHAFHSAMLNPVLDEFKKTLLEIAFKKPAVHFVSNVTGEFIKDEEATSADYWCKHMRETVRFSDGIKKILRQDRHLVFVEIGAGASLTALLKQHDTENRRLPAVNIIRPFKEAINDVKYATRSLGQLWAFGVNIDWNSYHKNEKRRKISVPTYSFEALSYPAEVDPYDQKLIGSLGIATVAQNSELKDWIYFPLWKQSLLPPALETPSRKIYLFFSSGADFTVALKKELLNQGHHVLEVRLGAAFSKKEDGSYIISALGPSDFNLLIRDIKQEGIEVTDVIYSLTTALATSSYLLEAEDVNLNLTYFCIIRLMQALQQHDELNHKNIIVLTDSLYQVTGIEDGIPLQSLLLGPVNVIPQEYGISCRNIDINLKEDAEKLAAKLVKELISTTEMPRIVAIRNGLRWLPDYQKNVQPLNSVTGKIKQGGIYLITGGLGNVGFILARHLIEKYRAKIILTGRTTFSGASAKQEIAQKRFELLKGLGEDLIYLSVNVADNLAFEKAVENVEETFGTINGVIHAAGVLDNNQFELIEDATVTQALTTFAPKLKGIENIYNVFKNRQPDFVWITSSISTLLGGLAFSAYSAANVYMDHFVSSKFAELQNWKCMGLAEMIFDDAEKSGVHQALIPAEITDLFEWSLKQTDSPVILETARDLFTRIREVYDMEKEMYADHEPENQNAFGILERNHLSSGYLEPETDTEKKLKAVFESFFGLDMIGVEDDFFELGGDSLKGMVLLKRIKKEFNINLTLRDFMLNVTIRAIAARIDEMEWFKTTVKMDNEITI